MPFQRKTLSTLMSEVAADISSALQGADALLRFAVLRVIGKVQAGMSHLQFGYLDWIAKQAVPFTAEDEHLEGWAALKKVYRKPASQAQLTAQFTGSVGKVLSAGTPVVRGDGVSYTTSTTGTVGAGGAVTVTIVADVAGTSGNADPGTVVSLGAAVDGIQTAGTVIGNVSAGADIEEDTDLRDRMLGAYQESPQGGALGDYVGWAKSVAGVTRAWCAPNGFGAGTVVVYTMWDNAEAGHGGFPQGTDGVSQFDKGPGGIPRGTVATGDQLVVADSIVSEQPVTALVYSCAPIPNNLTITLSGLTSATTATRAAIFSAIADVLFRNGDPRAGTINRDDISAAIRSVAGTSGFLISLIQGVVGTTTTTYPGNITSGFGQLPVLANVLYV
ncbi:baseplate J/gp47 family protein [Burkholderia multivorans]|uniref:Baseplate J/gp47 family protein n=1 Tax=Burkholderia multivorans TaxID=87883 RepID=A0AAP2HNF6_9BURK|nr:baseplate J/gp47 family protein [Burkholderia multivorans]MBU9359548.1 baseplate J/gp47 family protein [Burkholderia multivorans]MCO8609739.1 baseplate J/gp47 family protein [Burkholderia multivorans]MCO8638364.1 baseplate J/gp47 family protein [Burkholderia multivorans]MCO8644588.1 baseplate J/gp47 family protein [Burkholderia multivorans]